MWPGTAGTIPTGFSRVADLDGKFPTAAASTEPNVTGGNSTHTHTSSAHSHTMDSHTHSVNTNYSGSDGTDSDGGGSELTESHYHTTALSGLSGGGLSSVTSTYASVSNSPPYYDMIFIKPSYKIAVPSSAIVLWGTETPPTGYTSCNGDGGTPDLRNKYIRGATTGNDAGGTGGSTTNVHDLTHTHTESSHSHSGWVKEAGHVPGGGRRGSGTGSRGQLSHYHYHSLASNSAGSIGTAQLTTAETVEPAYKKVMAIKKTGTDVRPVGIIGMWLGSLATIPPTYHICDGTEDTIDLRDKFIKIVNTSTEISDTGGANTHTHASQGHTHTGGSHTHTNANTPSSHMRHDLNGDTGAGGVGGSWSVINKDRYHSSVDSVGSNSVTWASANTTGDSSSNEPEYRTVAYIQYTGEKGGGFILSTLAGK
jgi:hypothetical protein